MMFRATGLIAFVFVANENDGVVKIGWLAINKSLSFGGVGTANFSVNFFSTNSGRFFNLVTKSQEGGHRTERLSSKVLGKSGEDDTDIGFQKSLNNINNFRAEELDFFNGDDLSIRV